MDKAGREDAVPLSLEHQTRAVQGEVAESRGQDAADSLVAGPQDPRAIDSGVIEEDRGTHGDDQRGHYGKMCSFRCNRLVGSAALLRGWPRRR